METSGLFKEVGNQVQLGNKVSVPIKPTVNPLHQHNGVIHNGIPYSTSDHSKVDWTEMQDMPSPQSGKKNYERSCSQETMENLITKRKALEERGTSESTSGCDSGQNYESDEMDGNSDKSRNPSSVSTTEIIPTGDTNRGKSAIVCDLLSRTSIVRLLMSLKLLIKKMHVYIYYLHLQSLQNEASL